MGVNSTGKIIAIGAACVGSVFSVLKLIGMQKRTLPSIDNANQHLDSKCVQQIERYPTEKTRDNDGDTTLAGESAITPAPLFPTFYERYGKFLIDQVLSFGSLIILAPLYGLLALSIVIDDPGPVLFTQKRVGKGKYLFPLHKFRSMKMSTPHDVPTHMLENPEQYITRVGMFMRKYSLDELPQIWDIFVGNMSIIGPRPALWNQDDLVLERDKYGANDVTPGLTGWAQINGRDELEISDKARFDGDYVKALHANNMSAIVMDMKCFFGTIGSVLNHDGVVEGGTGELAKKQAIKETAKNENLVSLERINSEIAMGVALTVGMFALAVGIVALAAKEDRLKQLFQHKPGDAFKINHILATTIGIAAVASVAALFDGHMRNKFRYYPEIQNAKRNAIAIAAVPKTGEVKTSHGKRILITGANSYIGNHVGKYLAQWPETYQVDTLDMKSSAWRNHDFSLYDVVFHVAGIAHADVGHATEEEKAEYYAVNTDLAIETAQKAKAAGVRQFIFMSSMIVYGGEERITKDTIPKPSNFYGDSKWQADKGIRELADDCFKVSVLRPPMIYGKGSKGNFSTLVKIAENSPIFPRVYNCRSVLYVGNLCNFVKLLIDNCDDGVFFPQNDELISTSEIVSEIANATGSHIKLVSTLAPLVSFATHVSGKVGNLARKAFKSSFYDSEMSVYRERYNIYGFEESISLTAGKQ